MKDVHFILQSLSVSLDVTVRNSILLTQRPNAMRHSASKYGAMLYFDPRRHYWTTCDFKTTVNLHSLTIVKLAYHRGIFFGEIFNLSLFVENPIPNPIIAYGIRLMSLAPISTTVMGQSL